MGALGSPTFSEECSESEEEKAWTEVGVGLPLEDQWGEKGSAKAS